MVSSRTLSRGITFFGFEPKKPYFYLIRPLVKKGGRGEKHSVLGSIQTAASVVLSSADAVVLGVLPFRQSTSSLMCDGSSAETEKKKW